MINNENNHQNVRTDRHRNENNETGHSDIINDTKQNKTYKRVSFLGKGGFAKCYEVVDREDNKVYACKIISKSQLTKPHQKEKMASEISIHRSLTHPNIVRFYSYFEDRHNVYIILEVCTKRTLLELHKRRKTLTDPEVKYYIRQIAIACKHMHDSNVIHRDLKLGNLFLDDELQVKVGDFGLAAKIQYPGERKKTMCGTPNYIAPEILNKSGHSFKVDIWSLGCILYTLYVGVPPFETSNVRETYNRIKKNFYTIPSSVPKPAQFLIAKLLQSDPQRRPDITQVLEDCYFSMGYIPSCLPLSSLTVPPRFNTNLQNTVLQTPGQQNAWNAAQTTEKHERSHALRVCDSQMDSFDDGQEEQANQEPKDCYLSVIDNLITKLISKEPHKFVKICEEEALSPSFAPLYWVLRWVDYTERYGFGFQLSDRSFGVVFNDQTQMICTEDRQTIAYIDAEGVETFLSPDSYQPSLAKKKELLFNFYDYMHNNLLSAGSDIVATRNDGMLVRLPTLKLWKRFPTHILFLLNCGILQANFFENHSKIIVCPHLCSLTYINKERRSYTYRFDLLEKYGCSPLLVSLLKMVSKSIKEVMSGLVE